MNESQTKSSESSSQSAPPKARSHWALDRSTLLVLAIVGSAVMIEIVARWLRTGAGAQEAVSQAVTLLAVIILLAPASYFVFQMKGARQIKWFILSATVLTIFSQTLNITANMPSCDAYPVLSNSSPWHSNARSVATVLGLVLLLASVYLAMLEALRAKNKAMENSAALEREAEEHRRTEAMLRESEERYRLIFNGSQEGIVFIGADSQRGVFNDRLAAICGYTTEELKYVPSFSTLHPDDRGRILENNRRRLRHESFDRTYEFRMIHRDGHTIEVEGTFDAISRDGVVIGVCGIIRDISERKRIEASLREAQERYQALFERSLDILYVNDFEGNFVDANPAALATLGYTRDELPSLSFAAIVMPEDLGRAFQHLTDIRNGLSGSEARVYRLRRKDGGVIYVEANASLLCKDDVPCGILGVARDITERRLSESKIRELAEVIAAAPSSITIREFGGKLIYANERAYEIHQYTANEFAELKLDKLVAPGGVSLTRCRNELLADRNEALFETQHLRKDGSIVPLSVFVKVVEWLGKPALLSIATDITDRLRAESALRATESRYRRLFESAKDGILILDTVTGRILDANPYIETLLGYAPNELLGRALEEIGAFSELCELGPLGAKEFIRYDEVPLHPKNGAEIIVEFTSAAYLVESTRVLQCNIRDVSERKHLESQLRQAQKMEAVGQLAGGVAHDFNNLLQVILGNLDFVLEDERPSAPLAATLHEVRHAAERAADLTRQLLAFSRQQIMQPVHIDISDVVQDVLKILRRVIGEHIELCFIPRDHDGVVCIDKGQIEQVLMNLCVNARDAMPNGGRLTIETEDVRIDRAYCLEHPWAAEGRYVVISVSDNGEGMDSETLSHIFEPFFTTKEVGRGTGLGLATVYGIVKQHHGLIHVYSEPGAGAVFKVYLPFADQHADAPQETSEPVVRGGDETILIAEDEPMVLKLVASTLRAAGYTVYTANDGPEALRAFDEHEAEIDLVLLDVMMPGMSGREVMEHIRAKSSAVEFLFSSGYSQSAIHANFVIDAGLRLIQKPYHGVALQREVRRALDARAARLAGQKGAAN